MSAKTIPKTVFSGTAISAILSAQYERVDGVGLGDRVPDRRDAVFERVAGRSSRPGRAAAPRGRPARRSAARTYRSWRGPQSLEATAMRKQDRERHRRAAASRAPPHRRGCRSRSACTDVHRGDLGLERDVADDQHDRPELADGAGERQRRPGEDGGQDRRQDDLAGTWCSRLAPSECGRLLDLADPVSSSTGWTLRMTNGSVSNSSATTTAGRV